MARRASDPEPSNDKGRMRIVFVELDGNNQSLQEGLRTLVAAMNKPTQGAAPAKRISSTVAQESSPPVEDADDAPLFNQGVAGSDDAGDGAPAAASETVNGNGKKREGKKRDRNAGVSLVKDLNLRPAGKVSLRQFVEQKKPSSQIQFIAVFTYYLKKILELEKVGPNHIFTCFKEVEERVPEDLPQTIRNVASKKGWVDSGDISDLRLPITGENFVEHDLPEDDTAADNGTT